jgi:hypothetical protein
VSSALVGSILVKSAWNRLPEWIREDIAFHNNNNNHHHRESSLSSERNIERLSTVWEKIQAWLESASEPLKTPVPHLWAALLIYCQLCSQLGDDATPCDEEKAKGASAKNGTASSGPNGAVDFVQLKEMLNLATWAYYLDNETWLREQLGTANYGLKKVFIPTRPGSVGFYLAESEDTKTLLIGIKGTSSLEEILTDACGQSVPYQTDYMHNRIEVRAARADSILPPSSSSSSSLLFEELSVEVVSGHERIVCTIDELSDMRNMDDVNEGGEDDSHHVQCHEGILTAAQRLMSAVQAVVEERVIKNDNWRLVLVGHSLGAGAASILAMMLRSRYPEILLLEENSDKLQVFAFAPPPCLDHDSAIAASCYVTSVVNRSDLISRCSLANLAVLLELLSTISNEVLVQYGLVPTGPKGTTALLRQLSLGDKGKPLWTRQELSEGMKAAEEKVELRHPNHLYVPGKLFFLNCACQEEEEENNFDEKIEQQAESLVRSVQSKHSCTLTDGTAPALRNIEMNGFRMLGDHTSAAYHAAIDAILLSTKNGSRDARNIEK